MPSLPQCHWDCLAFVPCPHLATHLLVLARLLPGRFLRANNFDQERAVALFSKHLKWRERVNLDDAPNVSGNHCSDYCGDSAASLWCEDPESGNCRAGQGTRH